MRGYTRGMESARQEYRLYLNIVPDGTWTLYYSNPQRSEGKVALSVISILDRLVRLRGDFSLTDVV